MLGVIIGLAAVIILVSYAEGQNQQMRAYYESLGSNVININAYSWDSKGISDELYDYCKELDEYIVGFTPVVQMYNQTVVKYGAKTLDNYNSPWEESPQVMMGNQDFSLCNNFAVARGRDSRLPGRGAVQPGVRAGLQDRRTAVQLHRPHRQRTSPSTACPLRWWGVYEEKDPTTCPAWTAISCSLHRQPGC